MNEIGLLADKHTATCFKLAGLNTVFPVEDYKQAQKTLLELMENPRNASSILVASTNLLYNRITLHQ